MKQIEIETVKPKNYVLWAETILRSHKHLKGVINSIDNSIDEMAINAGTGAQETYAIMERTADLIARKTRIITLRVIITDMLNSLNVQKRSIITSHYIDGDSVEEIAEKSKFMIPSIRTLLNSAILTCAAYLMQMGFDDEYFTKKYGNEAWLISILKKELNNA